MRELLTDDDVAAFCAEHAGWFLIDGRLTRSATAPTFPAAIAWVDSVAQVAEEMDHHPDIDIRWRTVTFRLWTHSTGGITQLDLVLAERIDAVVLTQG